MLHDKYLPEFQFSSSHSIRMSVAPSVIAAVLNDFDFSHSAIIRLLFWLRGIPHRAASGIEGMKKMGFILLEHKPGSEVIFGLVGQFWKANGNIQRCSPSEFCSFSKPGFVMTTWNFEIQPRNEVTTDLVTETRINCTSQYARRRFALYWFFIRPFSGMIRVQMLKSIKHKAENLQRLG